MPLYNFVCNRCDYRSSRLMSYKSKTMTKDPGPCPKCYKGPSDEYTLCNIIGNSNFVLKGKWFKDGY
jgi:hypothetical protein